MKLIRSRFNGGVDDTAHEVTELRRCVVRNHVEFSDGVNAGRVPYQVIRDLVVVETV